MCVAFPAAALATGPVIDDANSTNVFDNHAEIESDIETGGAATTWQIKYATDASFTSSGGQYNQQTALMTVPSGSGPQPVSDVLMGLQANTTYDFEVEASSSGTTDLTNTFTTLPQASGTAGSPVTFPPLNGCPDVAQLTVNWGDGTSDVVPFTCSTDRQTFTLGSTHTYAAAGHYDVTGTVGETAPLAGAQIAAAATTTTTGTTAPSPPPPPPPPTDSLFGTVALATPSMATADPPTATPDAKAQVKVILRTAKGTVTRSTLTDNHGDYELAGLPSCIPGVGATGAVTCTVEVLGARGVIDDEKSVTLPAPVSNTRADLVAGRQSERTWISGVVLVPSDAAGNGGTASPAGWDLNTVGPSIRAAAGLGAMPHAASGAAGGLPTTDITVSRMENGKPTQIYDALKTCQQDHWGAVAPGLGVPSHRTDCTSTVGRFLLEGVPLEPPKGSAGAEHPHLVITLLERTGAGKYVAVDSAPFQLATGAKEGDRPLITAPALNSVVPVPDQPGSHTVSGQVTQLRPFLPRTSAVDPPPVAKTEVRLTAGSLISGASDSMTTRTDRNGYYAFSKFPKCNGKDCQYTVAVLTGKTVEDSQTFRPPTTSPSVTVENLTGNLMSDQLFVRGTVALPAGSGPLPDTEITLGPRGGGGTVIKPFFDSRTACDPKNWGPLDADRSGGPGAGPCASTVGSYLLSGVDRTANGNADTSARDLVITLLERNAAGKFVAIDSAPITLTAAQAQRHAQGRPIIDAPTLTAVAPVPTTTDGRTVSGTVTTFKPFLPGAPSTQPADAGAKVTVAIKAHRQGASDNVNRTLTTDAKGRYSLTGLPACNPKAGAGAGARDTCTVSVGSSKSSQDVGEFTLSELSPTTAEVDLQAGLQANSPVFTGTVKPPLAPGKTGPPHSDIQISTAKGQLLYDAVKACTKSGWSQPSPSSHLGTCVGGYGGYALGSIPTLSTPQGAAQVTVTLLEENAAGHFLPVDSVKIKLPPKARPGASPEVVSAPTLHG